MSSHTPSYLFLLLGRGDIVVVDDCSPANHPFCWIHFPFVLQHILQNQGEAAAITPMVATNIPTTAVPPHLHPMNIPKPLQHQHPPLIESITPLTA
eukprot:12336832-Ditylum_brightwellii.AAC.1